MQIVLATNWFVGFGGSETYLVTVAEELRALGHEPIIHARVLGEMAEWARARGIRVASEGELPERCDAVLVQDGGTACSLAARYPGAPQLFVAHSLLFDLQAPPQVDGLVSRVVVLNDASRRGCERWRTRRRWCGCASPWTCAASFRGVTSAGRRSERCC